MSDLLLLKNPRRCPRCHRASVNRDSRKCTHCGAILLRTGDTASKLDDEGLRSFYIHREDQGWIHSDHLRTGMSQPNQRDPKLKLPEKGYGTKPLPKGCSDK